MLNKRNTVRIVISGIIIVIVGFLYDVAFAGIPYQNPTPELVIRYNFHSTIADYIYSLGLIAIVIGLALFLLIVARNYFKKPS
ncbi:hypothetical protein [Phosphitispora sp. TUW77]|uniref:hypothetical protein n=1 Tax=Phosphitispora sp. TUW77 TaxID=3152361 RepID=UPI003AB7B959